MIAKIQRLDAELTARLKESRAVVIAGMAGTGKSDAAAAYAAGHEGEYELPMWLRVVGESKTSAHAAIARR